MTDGTPTGSNQPSSVTWTGTARGHDTSTEGKASFTFNLATTTVDAAITDFTGGQDDITRTSIGLGSDGGFGLVNMERRFHGDDHHVFAGTFDDPFGSDARGVFAASRR